MLSSEHQRNEDRQGARQRFAARPFLANVDRYMSLAVRPSVVCRLSVCL